MLNGLQVISSLFLASSLSFISAPSEMGENQVALADLVQQVNKGWISIPAEAKLGDSAVIEKDSVTNEANQSNDNQQSETESTANQTEEKAPLTNEQDKETTSDQNAEVDSETTTEQETDATQSKQKSENTKSTPENAKDGENRVQLTEEQVKEIESLTSDILEKRKQLIDKYVEYGVFTKEKADEIKSRMEEHYQHMKEENFVPRMDHRMGPKHHRDSE